jgi:cytidine deaminase
MSEVSDADLDALMSAACEAAAHAYAPYSRFRLGAAILIDGRVVTGVNVENSSYPLSVCAERTAVGAAVSAGARSLRAVAVAALDSEEPVPPCGGCRQVLTEFGGPDTVVLLEGSGGARARYTLGELLPHAFSLEA